MLIPQVAESAAPLLQTKLFVPTPRNRCLRRGRLFELLDAESALTLVSAPAGFGKTTLVGDWLRARGGRVGWLSLDPDDGSLRRFLGYLAGAVEDALPGAGASLGAALQAPQLPAKESLLAPLINELILRSENLVLVLDDYHLIDDAEVHAVVERLIERLPPGVRIVMITRADPPFALARWRVQGAMQEVRAGDLRFDGVEIHAFLEDIMNLRLAPDSVDDLARRTEGWIAGLQLAALSMRGRGGLDVPREVSAEANRYVLDYLAGEVLAGLDDETVDFLLAASVVDRFCGALCDALLQSADAPRRLALLESENLFLVPLDEQGDWYRFHHLFHAFLRREVERRRDAESLRELHRRAAVWLESAGLIDEAFQQALAAQDRDLALDFLERRAQQRLHSGDVGSAMRWFDALPREWIAERPQLVVDHALALFMFMRWREMSDSLEISRNFLAEIPEDHPDRRTLSGKQAALESWLATARADSALAARLGRKALDDLPREGILRTITLINYGAALIGVDDYDAARPVLREAAHGSGVMDRLLIAVTGYLESSIEFAQGRLHGAMECCRQVREILLPEGAAPDPVIGMILTKEAEIYLEWGDADRALELAEQAALLGRGIFPVTESRGLSALAAAHRARRDPEAALAAVAQLERLLERSNLASWELMSETHRAQIHCLQMLEFGDERAQAWLGDWVEKHDLTRNGDLSSKLLPDIPREAALLCAVRRLLACGETESAREMLSELRCEAEIRGWRPALIDVHLLEAQCSPRTSDAARESLRKAIVLAAPEGYVQKVLDEIPRLPPLPTSTTDPFWSGVESAYRERLLSATGSAVDAAVGTAASDLVEALSARELEVLTTIARGLSNAEAGESLCIAPSTVKKHLENVYGKLRVHNRVEAIARCRALGWLGPA